VLKVDFAATAAGAQALAVGVRPGGVLGAAAQAVNTDGILTRAWATLRGFKGEDEETLSVFTADGLRVLVGLGDDDDDEEEDEPEALRLRRIGGSLFIDLADSGIEYLTVALDLPAELAAELAYGMRLRAWRPAARYQSKPDSDEVWTLTAATIVTDDPTAAAALYARLEAVAEGAMLARDLVVAPANELTPPAFVERVKMLESLGVAVEVLDAGRSGLTLLQAVGQGSQHSPCLVVLRWNGGKPGAAPLAFVGKGITFDTGGLSIKDDDDDDMREMKGDMAGAAAVVGTLHALASRKARVNAVGVLAIAENMPSGRSMRPGDVLRSYAGLTVEVVDTDAEGRLVLADALAYTAATLAPRLIVDLATLTGAVEETLGRHRAGLFCADDTLANALFAAGEAEDEKLWRLPLTDRYDEALKSLAADLRNCSWDDAAPDALHAARFLQHFVPEGLPWAHLDIAGMAEQDEDGPLAAEGPKGFGVRVLDRLVADAFEE
jgi:leucyl aminopeptidase